MLSQIMINNNLSRWMYCLLMLFFGASGYAQVVSSNEALYAAILKSKAGDILKLADGNYENIQLIIGRSGKAGLPIVIRALNPGKVFFTGDAKVEMNGEHIILADIWFKNGNRNIKQWKSHGPGLVAIYGSYNRITGCVFDCFDQANSAYITTSLRTEGQVPQHCRIDHCSFTDKITFDQVINLNNTTKAMKDGTVAGPPMYHRVDHCFFSNPQKPGNAGGGIRIGYYRNDIGRCLIDSNLFIRQDSEAEIITSKSQENVFYANTFVDCQGTLNFRHGDHQVAINNFFLSDDARHGYGGMFIWGSKHLIACNYFQLLETIKSRGNAALYLNPGSKASEHALAFDLLIVNNAFINVNGYAINFNALDERRKEFCREQGLTFDTPYGISLTGNVLLSTGKYGYPFFKNDYADKHEIYWKDNLCSGEKTGLLKAKGIALYKFKLPDLSDRLHIPGTEIGYTPSQLNGIESIEGIDLDFNRLVSVGIKGGPLTWDDVRPGWLKEIPGTYSHSGILSVERVAKFHEVTTRK